ncbi:MAG: dTDP-4-dehydrorhamnose reductase [Gemmatimonadetes bacterium]|nr:dTDP-4-dehydrorhamnose reductase [Gemmatimonadota bacterium]
MSCTARWCILAEVSAGGMKILVTGARGLLGTEVVSAAHVRGFETIALGRGDLDVCDAGAVADRIGVEAPSWVVHCAAYTAVDRAEDEPEVAMRVNRDGAANVARAGADVGARTVYVSTDYVFDGRKRSPYLPTDPVGPLSEYGRTKLAGELAVFREAAASSGVRTPPLIVRTGWLYGAGGRNFVSAILRRAERGEGLKVVEDQRGRLTWGRNVAEVTLDLMAAGVEGIWHVADGGETTWVDVAHEALRIRGLDVEVEGVTTKQWGAAAPRPAYSVVDLAATEEVVGRSMMDWREALRRFLESEGRP